MGRALFLVVALCACAAQQPRPAILRVVTYNVQDLFVANRRAERMRAIGRALGELKPDLIGLQEAFDAEHRAELMRELERTAGRKYHAHYFPSGSVGSGCFTISAHPIVSTKFWRYTKNGSPLDVKQGDWYAGKGVGMVRVRVGSRTVDFFNTHAIANYFDKPYFADRMQQMRELAKFVAAEASGPALVVGDLNCRIGSPEYELGTKGLTDLMTTEPGRIDHLLCTQPVAAENFVRLFVGRGDDGTPLQLSDHPGYVLDVTLPPR